MTSNPHLFPNTHEYIHQMLHFQVSLQFINVHSLNQVRHSAIRQQILKRELAQLSLEAFTFISEQIFIFFKIQEVISCYSKYCSLNCKASAISYIAVLWLRSGILFSILQNLVYYCHFFHKLFPATSV